jgi:hypothetical protein
MTSVPAQVRVEHPEEHLALIKEALQEKEGIPVDQQRLIFGTEAEHVLDQEETTKQQPAAEEILSSLSQWQVCLKSLCMHFRVLNLKPRRALLTVLLLVSGYLIWRLCGATLFAP